MVPHIRRKKHYKAAYFGALVFKVVIRSQIKPEELTEYDRAFLETIVDLATTDYSFRECLFCIKTLQEAAT